MLKVSTGIKARIFYSTIAEKHYEPGPGGKVHAQKDGISAVRDYTMGGEKYSQPSQTTIERQPLFAPDLVVGRWVIDFPGILF
jgi:hypothetical protein